MASPRASSSIQELRLATPWVAYSSPLRLVATPYESGLHPNPLHPAASSHEPVAHPNPLDVVATSHAHPVSLVVHPPVPPHPPLHPGARAHGHPEPVRYVRKKWALIRNGFGSRHIDDDAPFSLWDADRHDFRRATPGENDWIFRRYQATALGYFWPFLVVETQSPPVPMPLTLGCVAAVFVPPPPPEATPLIRPHPSYCPAQVQVNTCYASPRVPDPITTYRLPAWTFPSQEQQEDVVSALDSVANLKRVTFAWPYVVVELQMDDRSYAVRSLPGRVAGCTTLYHHSHTSFWSDMGPRARTRLIDPGSSPEAQDTTDYLRHGERVLCPGVRVESAPVTSRGRYATLSRSTTAGVLLRNTNGRVRLTVASHGFIDSDEVFHPTAAGHRIGVITDRFEAHDVALVELDPSIHFTNGQNFEASLPKRLMSSDEVGRVGLGTWYAVDGMSTGLVSLFASGLTVEPPPRPTRPPVEISYSQWRRNYNFRAIGPTGPSVQDGICGAAIVEDDEDTGGVVGFFQLASSEVCLSPVLDKLIDGGWAVL